MSGTVTLSMCRHLCIKYWGILIADIASQSTKNLNLSLSVSNFCHKTLKHVTLPMYKFSVENYKTDLENFLSMFSMKSKLQLKMFSKVEVKVLSKRDLHHVTSNVYIMST